MNSIINFVIKFFRNIPVPIYTKKIDALELRNPKVDTIEEVLDEYMHKKINLLYDTTERGKYVTICELSKENLFPNIRKLPPTLGIKRMIKSISVYNLDEFVQGYGKLLSSFDNKFMCEYILKGQYTKVYFDIDIFQENREFYYRKTEEILMILKSVIKELLSAYFYNFNPNDAKFVIFDSSRHGKKSFHILISNYYIDQAGRRLLGIAQCKHEHCNHREVGLNVNEIAIFDGDVYNAYQPLRLVGTRKPNEQNIKKRTYLCSDEISGNFLEDSLVTVVDKTATLLFPKISSIFLEDYDKIICYKDKNYEVYDSSNKKVDIDTILAKLSRKENSFFLL